MKRGPASLGDRHHSVTTAETDRSGGRALCPPVLGPAGSLRLVEFSFLGVKDGHEQENRE